MKFAKIVFRVAGVYGVLSLAPLYFMFDLIGRQDPPPITHPQFYFGFIGVALAFQLVFLLIGSDPRRYRPMMIPSVIEKATYIVALAVLYTQGRVTPAQAATGVPDTILALLFLASYFKTAGA